MGIFHTFLESVRLAQEAKNSLVCVGIDPTEEGIFHGYNRSLVTLGMSDHRLAARIHRRELENRLRCFCDSIIVSTAPFAATFKINAAFFADLSAEDILEEVVFRCKAHDVPVILDAKRGDIGNTSAKYAREAFVRYGADAVTVNPYMGLDSVEPFLEHEDTGIILLCRTSNPGASDFQDIVTESGLRLFELVAMRAKEWDKRYGGGRIALVVGATRPEQLARVREIVGDMPLLVPGIGSQGGDVQASVAAGQTKDGFGMMINASRSIIFSPDPAKAANDLREEINLYRAKAKKGEGE